MSKKNIFDVLANAEDNEMNRITDKCPEISDTQLEKLLAKSERKYTYKKKEMDNMSNSRTITMNEYEQVSGVERHRPVWLRTVSTAASVFLALGVVIGSVSFLKHAGTGNINDGGNDSNPFAAVTSSVSTTTGTGTTVTAASGETYTTIVAVEDANAGTGTAANETSAPETQSTAAQETVSAVNTTAAPQSSTADTDKYVKIAEELTERFNYCENYLYGGLQVSSDTLEFRNEAIDWNTYTPQPGMPAQRAIFHKITDPNFNTFQSIKNYFYSTFTYEIQSNSIYLDSIDHYYGLYETIMSSSEYPSVSYVSMDFIQQLGHFISYDGELYVSDAHFGGGNWIYNDKPTIKEANDEYIIATRTVRTDLNPHLPFVAEFTIANHGTNGNDNWLISAWKIDE